MPRSREYSDATRKRGVMKINLLPAKIILLTAALEVLRRIPFRSGDIVDPEAGIKEASSGEHHVLLILQTTYRPISAFIVKEDGCYEVSCCVCEDEPMDDEWFINIINAWESAIAECSERDE